MMQRMTQMIGLLHEREHSQQAEKISKYAIAAPEIMICRGMSTTKYQTGRLSALHRGRRLYVRRRTALTNRHDDYSHSPFRSHSSSCDSFNPPVRRV
jgi:hypothetical protein